MLFLEAASSWAGGRGCAGSRGPLKPGCWSGHLGCRPGDGKKDITCSHYPETHALGPRLGARVGLDQGVKVLVFGGGRLGGAGTVTWNLLGPTWLVSDTPCRDLLATQA